MPANQLTDALNPMDALRLPDATLSWNTTLPAELLRRVNPLPAVNDRLFCVSLENQPMTSSLPLARLMLGVVPLDPLPVVDAFWSNAVTFEYSAMHSSKNAEELPWDTVTVLAPALPP